MAETDVLSETSVESGHFEGEVAQFDLAVESEGNVGALLDFTEYLVGGNEFALYYLPDTLGCAENEIRVAADVESLPAQLNWEIFQRLVEEVEVKTSILPAFLVPVFGLIAHPAQFLYFFGVERVAFEVVVVGGVELWEGLDAVVLE